MLLNGQERASATDSAVACRTRSADTMPYLRSSTKFLVLSDGPKPHPLLTGGLLVRVQPEEPFFPKKNHASGWLASPVHPVV